MAQQALKQLDTNYASVGQRQSSGNVIYDGSQNWVNTVPIVKP